MIPIAKVSNPFIPICVLLVFFVLPSKIFERLIFNSVSKAFYSDCSDDQFGFRLKGSTCYAPIKLHDHVTRMIDSPAVSGVEVFSLH